MSWLSSITGIGISPKGVKINPGRALGTVLTLGSMGALGPAAGFLGKIPGIAKLGGLGKIGGIFGGASKFVGKEGGGAEPGRFRSILDNVAKYGEVAGDAYGAYQSNQRQNRAVKLAEHEYAAGAPLRDASRRMLLDDSTPDTSGIFDRPAPRFRRVNVGSRV